MTGPMVDLGGFVRPPQYTPWRPRPARGFDFGPPLVRPDTATLLRVITANTTQAISRDQPSKSASDFDLEIRSPTDRRHGLGGWASVTPEAPQSGAPAARPADPSHHENHSGNLARPALQVRELL